MKHFFIVLCNDEPGFFASGVSEELFFAPLYEHTYRKFMDASNKLGLDVKFVRASTFELNGATNEISPDLDDIVVFSSPLAFLAKGEEIEKAISYVSKTDLGYATIGSLRDLYAVCGTGKMIGRGDVGSPADFIAHIGDCGAKCKCASFLETEAATPLDRADYFRKIARYREELLDYLVMSGVDIELRDGIIISPNTEIRKGVTILPGTQIRPWSRIHENCVIGPNSIISNSEIGSECVVNSTQIYDSTLESNVKIGPFCHVRPNSHLLSGVKVGDFVEIKNSTLGNDTHASHLTYIGDSDVGARVNLGCGVVTVNYDGKNKNRCKIADDAFIGCNTNLVAPVSIGKGAYTAAGSTITDNVPAGALAIAREYQSNHEGWAKRKRK